MTLCSDSQGRSTSLSLHHPKTPPHRHSSQPTLSSPLSILTLPHPKSPKKNQIQNPPPHKTHPFPQSHPHSPYSLPFYLHFFQKSPKFPINSTKSNQKLLISPKISQKSTKFTPKKSPYFPHYHTSIPQNSCKNTFLKTSQTHPPKLHTHAFITIPLINRLIHNTPNLCTDLSTGQKSNQPYKSTHSHTIQPNPTLSHSIPNPLHILNRLHPPQTQITHVSDVSIQI